MGLSMPSIPSSAEIAALTKEAMAPMAADLATIKDHMGTLVALMEEIKHIQLATAAAAGVHLKQGHNGPCVEHVPAIP